MGAKGVVLMSMWIIQEGETVCCVPLSICKVYPVFSALGWRKVPEGMIKSNKHVVRSETDSAEKKIVKQYLTSGTEPDTKMLL